MDIFKETFCRPVVEIYVLDLFDYVNSVGQFKIPLFAKSSPSMPVHLAKHIRHAVSINERRLKFKPALFQLVDSKKQDPSLVGTWSAGNHDDIGGGRAPPEDKKRLLSDHPLAWMIHEIKRLKEGADDLAIHENEELKTLSSSQTYITPHAHLAFDCRASRHRVLGRWSIGSSLPPTTS